MNLSLRRSTGAALVAGAVLVNVPYAVLVSTFDYPDVLRLPASEILARFHAAGPSLIGWWAAFLWFAAPLLFALPNLPSAMFGERASAVTRFATVVGVLGLAVQMVGLARWVFVVPRLASLYVDPAASESTRAAVIVAFEAVHAYGGVALGEHLGQALTIAWMVGIAFELLRTRRSVPLAMWGFGAAAIYAAAQGELFATVIPDAPQWGPAGLFGSLAWLVFLMGLGALLLRDTRQG